MTRIDPTRAVERCERLAKLGPAPAWWRVFALRRWLSAYRAIMALDISVSAEMLRALYPPDQIAEMAHRPNNTYAAITGRALTMATHRGERPGQYVEIVERVQIGADGQPDEDTRSIEVRE